MRKTFAITCVAALLVFSLCACGSETVVSSTAWTTADAATDAAVGTTATDNEEAATGKPAAIPVSAANSVLSNTLVCPATFAIGGEVYTFPIDTPAVFEADGWVVEEDFAGEALDPGDDVRAMYSKDGNFIHFTIENITEEQLPLNMCFITEMSLSENTLGGEEVTLAGGLTFGMSIDDILACYGEPDNHNVVDDAGGNFETFHYNFFNENEESLWKNDVHITIWVHEEKIVDRIRFEIDPIR